VAGSILSGEIKRMLEDANQFQGAFFIIDKYISP
jgi:hypothetical protein